MPMTDPTPPAEADRIERIELGGGWHFKRRAPTSGWFHLRTPEGDFPPHPWTEEDARAFAAAQRPAAPVDRETLVGLAEKGTDDWFHGKGAPRRVECIADTILAHLSAQPRVAVPEELRKRDAVIEAARSWLGDRRPQGADEEQLFLALSDLFPEDFLGREACSCGEQETCDECPSRAEVDDYLSRLRAKLSHPTTDAGSAER